jgi:hypothetical protein
MRAGDLRCAFSPLPSLVLWWEYKPPGMSRDALTSSPDGVQGRLVLLRRVLILLVKHSKSPYPQGAAWGLARNFTPLKRTDRLGEGVRLAL